MPDNTHLDLKKSKNKSGNPSTRPQDYPSTITFASSPEANRELVEAGSKSRRPGGSRRSKFGCKES